MGQAQSCQTMRSQPEAVDPAIEELTERLAQLHITPPFLSLPPELRLMVYEEQEVTFNFNYHFRNYPWHGNERRDEPTYALVERIPSPSFLQTCHTVHSEAKKYLQRAVLEQPPQIICRKIFREDSAGSVAMFHAGLLVDAIHEDVIRGGDVDDLCHSDTKEVAQDPMGRAFLKRAFEAIRKGDMLEVALYVEPGSNMRDVIASDLDCLVYMMTRKRPMYAARSSVQHAGEPTRKIVLAIQGLDIRGEERAFGKLRDAAATCGVYIHGVESTPRVDWKAHWGVEDLGSLDWTWGAIDRELRQYPVWKPGLWARIYYLGTGLADYYRPYIRRELR